MDEEEEGWVVMGLDEGWVLFDDVGGGEDDLRGEGREPVEDEDGVVKSDKDSARGSMREE
jgi:hypothetical protein